MAQAIIVAIIGFLGTAVGSVAGCMQAAKLTTYRLEQLEKKVELHNNVIKRTYELEKKDALIEEKIEFIEEDIKKFKKDIGE